MYFWEKVDAVALVVIAAASIGGVLLLVKHLPAIAESLVKISESLH
jgi:hypothetical protein